MVYNYGPSGTEFTANYKTAPEDKVELNYQYGANGTGRTGTLAPESAVVRPPQVDVRTGVNYGLNGTERTGTCAVPKAGDTRQGVAVDATTGTLQLPGVQFVILNTGYGENGTEFIGQFHSPAVEDVRSGVGYGAGGIEFTGTLIVYPLLQAKDIRAGVDRGDGVLGDLALPVTGRVIAGVQYDTPTAPQIGTFVYPTAEQVVVGVSYGENGTEFSGTAQVGISIVGDAFLWSVYRAIDDASGLTVPANGDMTGQEGNLTIVVENDLTGVDEPTAVTGVVGGLNLISFVPSPQMVQDVRVLRITARRSTSKEVVSTGLLCVTYDGRADS